MANRNFPNNKVFGFHLLPVRVRCAITNSGISGDQAFEGPGVKAVTQLGQGVYQIQLQDNYAQFLHVNATVIPQHASGGAVDPAVGNTGSLYRITIVGDTDWATAGLPSGITAQVGQTILLAAHPAAGTGRAVPVQMSECIAIHVVGDPNLTMQNNSGQPMNGGYVTVMAVGSINDGNSDPGAQRGGLNDGDILLVDILLNNSNVQ